MQYLVHGLDNPDVAGALDALAEQHWAYMDRHAEHLVARGPTLSPDGTAHTGSVHVLEAPTLDDARRFAIREPFHLAGLYASVTVTRFENALAGSMWDRPPPREGQVSTLVLLTWPAAPHPPAASWGERTLAVLAAQETLVFGGLLTSEDAACSLGLVAAVDDGVVGAEQMVAGIGLPETATSMASHRWQRGGRNNA